MILVNPINRLFTLKIAHDSEFVEFTFKQLSYAQKDLIAQMTTNSVAGEIKTNVTMNCFYVIKYGLKSVKGLSVGIENGREVPYLLKFDDLNDGLTDECVEELMATVFEDNLIYSAMNIFNLSVPKVICHPVTGKPIEGIEVLAPELKKNS